MNFDDRRGRPSGFSTSLKRIQTSSIVNVRRGWRRRNLEIDRHSPLRYEVVPDGVDRRGLVSDVASVSGLRGRQVAVHNWARSCAIRLELPVRSGSITDRHDPARTSPPDPDPVYTFERRRSGRPHLKRRDAYRLDSALSRRFAGQCCQNRQFEIAPI